MPSEIRVSALFSNFFFYGVGAAYTADMPTGRKTSDSEWRGVDSTQE